MIKIQFVTHEGVDWPLTEWPAVPRVGEHVVLPDDDDGRFSRYQVERVVWEKPSEVVFATVYLHHLYEEERP